MNNNENYDFDMGEIEMPVLESLDGSDTADEKPSAEYQDFVVPQRERPVQTEVKPITTSNGGWQERQESFFAANYNEEKLRNLEQGEKMVKAICIFMVVSSVLSLFLSFGGPAIVTNGIRIWLIHKFYKGGFLPWLALTVMNVLTAIGFFSVVSKVDFLARYGLVPNSNIVQLVYAIFGIGYLLVAFLMAFDKRIRAYCT